jgi:hypothetical protein
VVDANCRAVTTTLASRAVAEASSFLRRRAMARMRVQAFSVGRWRAKLEKLVILCRKVYVIRIR